MTKDEAQSKGMKIYDTKHSMMRRCEWHDYRRKGTYHITLLISGFENLLGTVEGDADAPASSPNAPKMVYSRLAKFIEVYEFIKIHQKYPMVELWKFRIMSDHIHMIVHISEDMEKHLGQVIAGFKGGCSRAARDLGISINKKPVPKEGEPVVPLFEPGYNDKILWNYEKQFGAWINYLNDNPRRFLVKQSKKAFFAIRRDFMVADTKCQILGNRFLLDYPEKVAVIYHHKYSAEKWNVLCERWLACGSRGGVLVSAAIHPNEKEVIRTAYERGYKIIRLRQKGFPDRYKPEGRSFDYCAEGLLLLISPWEYYFENRKITRDECKALNALAEKIVGEVEE